MKKVKVKENIYILFDKETGLFFPPKYKGDISSEKFYEKFKDAKLDRDEYDETIGIATFKLVRFE